MSCWFCGANSQKINNKNQWFQDVPRCSKKISPVRTFKASVSCQEGHTEDLHLEAFELLAVLNPGATGWLSSQEASGLEFHLFFFCWARLAENITFSGPEILRSADWDFGAFASAAAAQSLGSRGFLPGETHDIIAPLG